MKSIKIKDDYGNGSASYWSERVKGYRNIPNELAKQIKEGQRQNAELLEVLEEIFEAINLADHSFYLYKRAERAIKNTENN